MRSVRGSGGSGKGGGNGARVPSEQPDNLQSKAFAKVLDLISEGPIVGLVDGLKSVYLDETPIQAPSGDYNFQGVDFDFRQGTQDQTYVKLFSDTENEIIVNTEVSYAGPVIKSITNTNLDAVDIKIAFPQLTYQNPSTGDLSGTAVTIAIDLDINGGGFVEKRRDTVKGKSTSKYEKSYRIELEGTGPWSIRIRRITADSNTVALQNKTYFESYTEIIEGKLRYPNSALVGVRIDSSYFSNIPSRAFHIKGMIIKIPSNYNPITRTYSGVWDGNFTTGYSNNPAWVWYDLVTDTRYGLGQFISASQVDKWALYSVAKFCDELVPDGYGGFEPRYTCNLYLQTRQEAYRVIQDLASVFNAMIYWASGSLTVSQDAPSDAAHLFTPANVVDGLFTYSGASAKARHSVALVTWNDPDDFCRQKIEYVEDAESIARFGIVEAQVTAFGCTSRGQANRLGRWLLYTERMQSEVVTFKTGLASSFCRPGQVIKIQDPVKAGVRLGGRMTAATTTTITVDQDVSFDPSTSTLSVILPDGSVQDRQILSASGRTIQVATAFTAAPLVNSMWIVTASNVAPLTYRIVSISESENGELEISAIAHDPNKYAAIEQGLVLEPKKTSVLDVTPEAPTGLQITETLYAVNGEVRVKVTVSWNKVAFATSYDVSYSRDSQNPIDLPETSSNEIEILNAEPGLYKANVIAVSSLGLRSTTSTTTKQIVGKSAPPSNVQGFSLVPNGGTAYLSWNKATDLDVLIGGSVRIRYSPNIGATWKESVDIAPGLAGSATRADVPLLAGTYLAKFVDSSDNSSLVEASISTTVPQALSLNVVQTVTENPTFAGTKTNMEYTSAYAGLALSAGILIDSLADIDSIPSFDYAGGVSTSGQYFFQNTIDLTDVYTSRVTALIEALGVDVADSIDFRISNIDDWLDLDGNFIDDVNAELFVRTTNDDPGLTPVWTAWKRFFVADYTARAFQFMVQATSQSDYHNIVLKQLGVTIDMPDRVFNQAGLVSGSGITVTYDKAFRVDPAVGITAYGMNTGDYYTISNKTRAGFDIVFKNSSGTTISKTFDVIAKGYGRQAI